MVGLVSSIRRKVFHVSSWMFKSFQCCCEKLKYCIRNLCCYLHEWLRWILSNTIIVCVLQDFLFQMINLWSSMKVSHLHLYTQLLPSSEWQLCFTRRYSSAVWRTFCVKQPVEVICAIFKIDGEQNFQSHFWCPSQYSDWAVGTEFWFLAGIELGLLDCPGAHWVSCLLHTGVMYCMWI